MRARVSNPYWLHTPEVRAKISKAHKGKQLTPEHREKLRQAKLHNWQNPAYRQHMSDAHKGQLRTPETIEKWRAKNSGENHWNWQGGNAVEINKNYTNSRWKKLRREILERDNYTCRHCFKQFESRKLHVHHIIPYRKTQDNDPSNLLTLCIWCHKRHYDFKRRKKAA